MTSFLIMVFLVAGQEIEKEAAQPPDLQIIQSRIRDIIHVLQDFRSGGRAFRQCLGSGFGIRIQGLKKVKNVG